MVNIYQKLVSLNKIPDECIGKNVVSVFKSKSGHIGFGLFNEICHVEKESEKYRFVYSQKLDAKMLFMTSQEVLALIKQIYCEIQVKNNFHAQESNKKIIKRLVSEIMYGSKRKIQ